MAATRPTYYEVLGITPQASDAEIRGAFKRLARKYHPDKRTSEVEKFSNPQTYDDHSDALAGTGAASFDDMFSLLANAYSVLSDGVKRAGYDLELMGSRRNGQRSIADSLRRLREMKKQDAELQVNLMEITAEHRRETENKKSGLVFIEAWYGATHALTHPSKHPREVINVSRQLQTMIENSRLVLPKGETKSIAIPGVFDPCPENSDKSLRVVYTFKGKLHEATVADEEILLVPMKNHLVSNKHSEAIGDKTLNGIGEEVKILLGPGAGQIVQRKPQKPQDIKRSSWLKTSVRLLGLMGAVLGVAGSIATIRPETRARF